MSFLLAGRGLDATYVVFGLSRFLHDDEERLILENAFSLLSMFERIEVVCRFPQGSKLSTETEELERVEVAGREEE